MLEFSNRSSRQATGHHNSFDYQDRPMRVYAISCQLTFQEKILLCNLHHQHHQHYHHNSSSHPHPLKSRKAFYHHCLEPNVASLGDHLLQTLLVSLQNLQLPQTKLAYEEALIPKQAFGCHSCHYRLRLGCDFPTHPSHQGF